ncbi:MAG: aminoglycoside adenylyltransferase domain-containing protein [Acetivibrionales bacterium]|jgi:hypothetical protein
MQIFRYIYYVLEGGIWGIENLPLKYNQILETSVEVYQNQKKLWKWDNDELINFADHMLREIYSLTGSEAQYI